MCIAPQGYITIIIVVVVVIIVVIIIIVGKKTKQMLRHSVVIETINDLQSPNTKNGLEIRQLAEMAYHNLQQ